MIENELYKTLCDEFFPIFKKILASERYAITLGGSHGKGVDDKNSDFDFRIYYDNAIPSEEHNKYYHEVWELVKVWKAKGVEVDGVWPRSVSDVDGQLDAWLSGKGTPTPREWSIWGYNILTDIYNQAIVEDPYGIVKTWKDRLSVYSTDLKNSIFAKHGSSIKYWRSDYHYLNKVNRKDIVFLSSISARLVHDIMQIIYALNEFYYPGDGYNLVYSRNFKIKRKLNLKLRIEN